MILTYLSLLLSAALAAPTSLSYEGVLTDVLGNPVTVPVSVTARIAGDTGGSCIVNGSGYTTSVTPDASGFFAIQIPSLTSDMFLFPGTCAGSTDRYLLITVEGDNFPAIQMDSAPFAMSAAAAGKLVGAQGAGSAGEVLTWNGTGWVAQTPAAAAESDPTVQSWAKTPTSFAAGQVVVANGSGSSLLSLNCTNGQVVKYNASGQAVCGTDDSGGAPTGSAGGVLSGTYPSPSLSTGVITLVNLSSMGLSVGDAGRVLKWNGSTWTTAPDDNGLTPVGTPGTYGSASSSPQMTIDTYGRVTGITLNPIAIDASAITTGILPLSHGGTGMSTATANRLIMSNGSATSMTEVPVCTAGQVLAYDSGGPSCLTPSTSPTGTAGGDLTGTYPNPVIATGAITSAKIADGSIATADLAFSVVENLGGTPSIQSGILASRPAFGTTGRLYLATDTNQLFRDTGSAWNAITIPGVKVLTASPWTVAVGNNAAAATTGTNNSAFGTSALQSNLAGTDNVAIGYNTIRNSTNGYSNTSVGSQSLFNLSSGAQNTAIGYRAGENAQSSSTANIFIGQMSGPLSPQIVNDKLYIDTSPDDTPLIFGDFVSRYVSIDGPIKVGTTAAICNGAFNGAFRYTGSAMQYCDGVTWQTVGVSGGGVASISVNSPLTNTGTASVPILGLVNAGASGQTLRWTGSVWTTAKLSSADLADMSLTAPSTNQVLKWNGSQWSPSTDSGIMGSVASNRIPRSNGGVLEDSIIYDSTFGQIGIGTTTPGAALHVNGDILGSNLRIGPPGGSTNLFSGAIGDIAIQFPSGLPAGGYSGVMTLASTGTMSWQTCGSAGQILQYNGANWACTDIPKAADQLVAVIASCGGDQYCDLPPTFAFSAEQRIALIRFASPGASATPMQLGINGSNYNYVYQDGTSNQILVNTIPNGEVYFVKYKPTASPAGWYLEINGGGGGNGGYDKASTVISAEFTKSIPGAAIMDTTGTEIEPTVWSTSGGVGSGYRGPYSIGEMIPGTVGTLILQADTAEWAGVSMCDPSNAFSNRIRPSAGTIYSLEAQVFPQSSAPGEVTVGFGVPTAFDAWSQSYSAMARVVHDAGGMVGGSYSHLCYGFGACETALNQPAGMGGGYHVRVEYRGTQSMKVFLNGTEAHNRTTAFGLSGSNHPCPMLQLKGTGGTTRVILDNLVLKKWNESGVP